MTRRTSRTIGRSLAKGGAVAASLAVGMTAAAAPRAPCPDGQPPIYLTFDTGSESQATLIHDVLKKYDVKATFFLANEKTVRGDWSLDPSWASYWKTLAAEGHAFGTHTFDHVYYRGDAGDDAVWMRPQFGADAGRSSAWSPDRYCDEMKRVATRFRALTGRDLDPFWRAPGGRTSPRLLAIGERCGYRHFGWSAAGFLGDELSSERFSNAVLLERAKNRLRGGDIVLMHLGIRSRKDPLATILDPLIADLRARGHCFATLRDYPSGRAS